jgi:hypothetical protein
VTRFIPGSFGAVPKCAKVARVARIAKPSKYRNKPVVADGIKFDSGREHKRYQQLALMERAGVISNLRRQVSYELVPALLRADGKAELPVHYLADFVYEQGLTVVVEDVKSEPTRKLPAYIIKRKLMLHVHGITLKETL